MNTHAYYDYLVKARHDLWPALLDLDDDLARQPIPGGVWTCLKHLVLHTAVAEDAWLRADIQRLEPLRTLEAALDGIDAANVCDVPMADLVAYWQRVEEATLAFLPTLDEADLDRMMTPYDDPDWHLRVGDVLWHVMTHEVRHTAQMVSHLRSLGVTPPSLDLVFYLKGSNR